MNSRYSRQILFPPIGESGQRALKQKHVLIIGAGALGSSNAEVLVRAGVGKVTIVDRDYVDWSNLQRQQLYEEADVVNQLPKAIAAKQRLTAINADVHVEAYVLDATVEELTRLMEDVDLVIDATDNFDTRLLVNDLSMKYCVPWIYGACVGSYGLSYVIVPGETPCLSCLLESIPLGGMTCDTVGIISPAVQMVVAHQTTEALKILTSNTEALSRKLVSFDLWKNEFSRLDVQRCKNSNCASCGENPTYPFLAEENQTKSTVLCGRDTVQMRLPNKDVDLEHYAHALREQATVTANPYLLSFMIEEYRLVLFKDGRVLIHGTKDITKAKTLYHRFFG
ncbi:thiazole biosynthesis adenylyltransferase ThiF [Priestia taiwanensis]|uniref:thiazole biosynthesis adenylyltransferase ThiF n=1 Tax=Priestia taiwanensis TaxID=1347902 RepID=UPI0016643E54|nr:thiazole biosynthesis adenylyltransferase ThiF [Priestia taiwanensis]MBM7363084.1 molybdopterin/thiamine biosynthesis adenylyltransferase [Priestia taiwanensis]